ncbi:MAG: YcjF family protein [Xanthobacteraceae bacterium]
MVQQSSATESPVIDETIATPTSKEERSVAASKLVDRFAIWSGVAGLIPVPVVDVLCVGGVQVQMLRRLSQIYDVRFSENRGKALIAALAGTMIPATSGMGAASALKAIPVVNLLAAGFVMPVLSAGATFAIGRAFAQHFESGGTLLDFNPPDYREFIKAQKEMWDSRRKRGDTATTTSGAATTSP